MVFILLVHDDSMRRYEKCPSNAVSFCFVVVIVVVVLSVLGKIGFSASYYPKL